MSDSDIPAGYGQEPRSNPAARPVMIIVGLLLLALAVVAGRDLWAYNSTSHPPQWLGSFLDSAASSQLELWHVIVGVLVALLGLILLWLSLKPRARRHSQLASTASFWARPIDIARMATATARNVPGVDAALSNYNGKSVTIDVTGNAQDETLATRVVEAVSETMSIVAAKPDVHAKVRSPEEVQKS